MIAYVTIGTNNMERATKFYNTLLAEVDPGIKVLMDAGRIKLWGKPGSPNLAVCSPFDGKGASVGNGVMVALAADSPAKVDAIYKKALELGGTDEGAPARRGGDKGPYIGYFRDLDGNKLNAICMKYVGLSHIDRLALYVRRSAASPLLQQEEGKRDT